MSTSDRAVAQEHNNFKDIIEECLKLSKDGHYIFRGTNREYTHDSNRIKSSLYLDLELISHIHIEEDLIKEDEKVINCAKHLFPHNTDESEILTELRHYGEKLCIIDFTMNLLVALFFACQNTYDDQEKITKKNGEIVLLKKPKSKPRGDKPPKEPYVIMPATNHPSNKRVLAQSSILVNTPNGFIDYGKPYIFHTVKVEYKFKKEIANYLHKFHNINPNTIFGDVFGFIDNKSHVGLSDFELGKRAFKVRKFEDAINYFTEFLKSENISEKNTYTSLAYSGLAHLELKNFDKVIDISSQAIAMRSLDKFGLIIRGIALLKKGDNAKALSDMNTIIENNSKDNTRDALIWRTYIYINLKNFKGALKDMDSLLKVAPESKESSRLRELLTLKLNTNQADIEFVEPNGIQFFSQNKLNYSSKKIYNNLLDMLDKEINLATENAFTYINRGKVKFYLKNFNGAISDLDTAIKLLLSSGDDSSPHISNALHIRGLSKINCSDYDLAIQDFDEALKLSPISPEIMTDRANVFYIKGQREENQNKIESATKFYKTALTELNVAITLNSELINSYYIRHMVYYALEKYKEAREDLWEINRLNKKNLTETLQKSKTEH